MNYACILEITLSSNSLSDLKLSRKSRKFGNPPDVSALPIRKKFDLRLPLNGAALLLVLVPVQ